MTSYDDNYYGDCYVNDDIDYLIDVVSKKELIRLFHIDYDIYMGSNYMTLEEICRGRKKITEDDIRNLPENDEGYQIAVDTLNHTIDIWL